MLSLGVSALLQELESHCTTHAIATFLDSDGKSMKLELQRRGQDVIYGRHWGVKELFVAKLMVNCRPTASLILRSFTSELDEFTQLPIKELRGYLLQNYGDDLEFEKLSPNTMFACHNTDAATGEPLPLEQGVRYC
ncbi:MAG TPA: hypothetical protein V6D50_11825 [Chroococcales cyanobacterium]|jgi:hypothetical protein